jgi:hypothetical protein
MQSVGSFYADMISLPLDDACALIRSRDKAIIDACKEAIANGEPLTAGEFESRYERLKAIEALDSVLREIFS